MSNKPDLSLEKWAVVVRFSKAFDNASNRLPKGALPILLEELQISDSTLRRVVAEYGEGIKDGDYYPTLESTKVGNVGRPSKLNHMLKAKIKKANKDKKGQTRRAGSQGRTINIHINKYK